MSGHNSNATAPSRQKANKTVLMLRGIAICARLDASALKSFFELAGVWVEYITSSCSDEALGRHPRARRDALAFAPLCYIN